MIRLLILIFLLAPQISWGQSSLPPCPESEDLIWSNCFGRYNYPNGDVYVGEWRDNKLNGRGTFEKRLTGTYIGEFRDDKLHGEGVFTFKRGEKYVGEYRNDLRHGLGIEYNLLGYVIRSGTWENGRFISHMALDTNRFPFNQNAQSATKPISALDTTKAEFDRLTTAVETELKKRQELEGRLAAAEAKEGERQQAQQPQRPQAVLRNERRLALIIGNSSYKVSPLDNPANDATDIAESLKKFGFQTTLVRNATLGQMREATRKFADQLPLADVALIYFAGHGIESNRKNYMIPVNADLKFEYELADQGYDAGIWLEMLESIKSNNADRVNIVILDACRNNSLIGSRNLGRGLGKMDAPSGTFLAYSTAPGKVAADGGRGERNSPFTKHLLRAMQQPNQPIEEVFKEVRRNVGKETNGAQVPWESTSLTGFFAFRQARER